MSGSAYFARGASTGQAPTTVFFGAVPDKYNMLMPFYSFNTGSSHSVQFTSALGPATNINTWVPWDDNWAASGGSHITATIGSTTTAPDGTSTAYHVTEGTNTGYHIMVAGTDDYGLFQPGRRRLAVFAKAAERTRCWLEVGEFMGLSGTNGQFECGVRCVFDLAGGQIGVPVAAHNTGALVFTAVGSGMIPFGNGWYLCYIDASMASNAIGGTQGSGCLQAVFGIDSGSGTGAISNSYAGDGASGVFAWNANMMPPRAYGMNSISYFSDFNSISEIDVNNTLAQGFKWYCAGATWPGVTYFSGGWQTPIPPGTLTVSGSKITIPGGTTPAPNMTSAAYNGSGGYVGSVFAPPHVFEWKGHFDYVGTNSDELVFWAQQLEYIIVPGNDNRTAWDYQELDTVDSGTSGAEVLPILGFLDDATPPFNVLHGTQNDTQINPFFGVVLWSSTFPYPGAGFGVGWAGQVWDSLAATTGDQPDISPAKWAVHTPSQTEPPNNTRHIIDLNQDQLWTYIRIDDRSRYAPFDDTGIIMTFFNQIQCISPVRLAPGGSFGYGCNMNPKVGGGNTTAQSRDSYHSVMILASGTRRSIFADYVRVYQ